MGQKNKRQQVLLESLEHDSLNSDYEVEDKRLEEQQSKIDSGKTEKGINAEMSFDNMQFRNDSNMFDMKSRPDKHRLNMSTVGIPDQSYHFYNNFNITLTQKMNDFD